MYRIGQLLITAGVYERVSNDEIQTMLSRHVRGDWGIVCDEDKEENDDALRNGGRILSAYQSSGKERVWIITEADRSATTILLPEEY